MDKIIINLSNISGGGGLQVALSFLFHLSGLNLNPEKYTVLVNKKIISSMPSNLVFERGLLLEVGISSFFRYMSFDFLAKLIKARVCFTLFGPCYIPCPNAVNIVGFARPHIIFDLSELQMAGVDTSLPFVIKRWAQKQLFKRADYLIVESDGVKRRVKASLRFHDKRIIVCENGISPIFLASKDSVGAFQKIVQNSGINLGIISRGYVHKNLAITELICGELSKRLGAPVTFWVTLTDSEYDGTFGKDAAHVKNVGPVSLEKAPGFYKAIDAVLFPSLMECFSITPLEGMLMQKPVFASDRWFIRDVCGDRVVYFDPLITESVVDALESFYKGEISLDLFDNSEFVKSRFSATKRAERYVQLIESFGV